VKKILYVMAGLLILTVLAACGVGLSNHQSPCGLYRRWQGLHMYVAPGSVTPTGLRLSIINKSELYFMYGAEFRIDRHTQDGWRPMPPISAGWFTIGFISSPNTVVEEDKSWEHMQLQPGLYRIVRNFREDEPFAFDPTPIWEREISEAYLYAVFTVKQDNANANYAWQKEQDELEAIMHARFDGLDLEILDYSPRGLSFTFANNNLYYSYIISGVFVGWGDTFPCGGFAWGTEYFVFSEGRSNNSWPFGNEKRLHPGEYLSLEVDWYNEIGYLYATGPTERPYDNRYIFNLTVGVALDVSDEYAHENFRRIIPGVPIVGNNIMASFDLESH